MSRNLLCTILWAAFATSGTLPAAELRLRPDCQPTGSLVTLGDVAEIYAQDKAHVERLVRVELFPAPGRGQRRFLHIREMLEILHLRSVDLTDCRISGVAQVTIQGPAAPQTPNIPPTRRPVASPAPAPPAAAAPETVVLAVAAARPVERGQVIQAADLQLVPLPPGNVEGRFLPEIAMAVGQEAVRDFAPGQPLDPRGLRRPLWVRRREPVRVVVFAPGVRLTTEGLSLDDGAEGDWVAIETPHTQEKVRARVIGPKQVEVYAGAPPSGPAR